MLRRYVPIFVLLITIFQVTSLAITSSSSNIREVSAEMSENSVLLVYGTETDLNFGETLAINEVNLETINVTKNFSTALLNNTHGFDALWWIVSIPNNKSLSQFNKNAWDFNKIGLFIISNYLENFYYNDGDIIDLEAVNDFQVPENRTKLFELNIKTEMSTYLQNESIPSSLTFETQLSLVIPGGGLASVSEFTIPNIPQSTQLTSGIFLSKDTKKKMAVCTFRAPSIANLSPTIQTELRLKQNMLNQQDSSILILFFQQIANYSMSSAPTGDLGVDFDVTDLPYPLIILGGLLGFIALWFLGLGDLIKSILFSIFVAILTVIYHLYYVPESRRLTKHDLTDNEVREGILNFLHKKGVVGGHLREIQRHVDCGISSLLWHLQILEDFDYVTKRKVGRYHIYNLTNLDMNKKQKNLAKVLRSDIARQVWEVLNNSKKPLKLSDISKEIGCHHETARYHLKRFVELNLVNTVQKGRRTLYSSKDIEMHPD